MKKDLFSHLSHQDNCRISHLSNFSHATPIEDNFFSTSTEEDYLEQFGELQSHYEDLIGAHALAEPQNEVFLSILSQLVHGCECPSSLLASLKFSFSDEEGVIIYRHSEQGVSFIAIDDEGDSMFSFSPYKGVGERRFFDYGSGSEEAMAYRLLAR